MAGVAGTGRGVTAGLMAGTGPLAVEGTEAAALPLDGDQKPERLKLLPKPHVDVLGTEEAGAPATACGVAPVAVVAVAEDLAEEGDTASRP
jgi:hypothetical protein